MKDDEFERLYTDEAQGLFAFLAYRTGDRALAEDLLADAFERALRGQVQPRARARRRPGCTRSRSTCCATTCAASAAEGRAYARVEAGAERADPFAGVEVRDELMRALARLAAEEREAIALRFGADLTVPEMATVLGEPLTTVEGRVYRALRKLREALA